MTGHLTTGTGLVVGMGLAHTAAFAVAALLLAGLLVHREHVHLWSNRLVVPVLLATGAGVAAWLVLQAWAPSGRIGSLLALIVLGGGVAGICLLASRRLGMLGPRPDDRLGVVA